MFGEGATLEAITRISMIRSSLTYYKHSSRCIDEALRARVSRPLLSTSFTTPWILGGICVYEKRPLVASPTAINANHYRFIRVCVLSVIRNLEQVPTVRTCLVIDGFADISFSIPSSRSSRSSRSGYFREACRVKT